MQAQVDEKDRQLQELRELNAELEDEIEVLAEGAGGGGGARVAQLEDELERLEQALEGRGGGAGEVGRLRREKRALQEERDELEEQVEELQAGAGAPTGTGGGGDPAARAAELEERLRSLQLFGAMNVPGAALPEPGSSGFEAFRTGPSEAELEEMEREREDLEDALTEAEEVAAAVDSIPGRRMRSRSQLESRRPHSCRVPPPPPATHPRRVARYSAQPERPALPQEAGVLSPIRCGTLHVHSGCWSVRGRARWPRRRCLREQRVR